jgi:thiol:disulfide interchange protein DsbC
MPLAWALIGMLSLASQAADLDTLKKLVQQKLVQSGEDGHGIVITSVRATPYAGLFEVVTEDHKLVYVDERATYLFTGHIFEMKGFKDLTGERLDEITAVKFDSLPLDFAIKQVKGNGKRKVAVFSDSDCPYCKKLVQNMASITDITVYTFLYPIPALHPNAIDHSKRIWCASDRAKAWEEYWAKNVLPEARNCDTSALDKTKTLGSKLGVEATPTLIFANGRLVPGAIPTDEIEKGLSSR